MSPRHLVIALAVLGGIAISAAAQSFEAAMFRLEDPNNKVDYNRPDAPNQTRNFPSNRLIMYHTYLKSLIVDAYGVKYQNILGGPAWLDSQHYDLSAKVSGNTLLTKKQMSPMLRHLLEERLHLVVHTERRIVSGYALVIAKGGSKLKPTAGAPYGGGSSGFEYKFQNAPVGQIASGVEYELKQPVVDKTGLTGTYDFDLIFTRDDHPTDVPHPDYGNLFTALEKELGLKLQPQKIPVDYLIIDHIEKIPTDN
jgi:uncharacterized protein (TIGR03435 family)